MSVIIIKKRILILFGLIIFLILIINSKILLRAIYPIYFKEDIYYFAREYRVDPLLTAAIIRVESKFDERAESKKGAVGLMQIMPATGAWAAEQIGMNNYEPGMLFDPRINIKIGTWYLSSLQQEFPGNVNLVIASYNGGRGRVKGWLEEGIWDGRKETIFNIPFPETKNFVEKVLLTYEKYKTIYSP